MEFVNRPKLLRAGEIGAIADASHFQKRSEHALLLDLVLHRRRLGQLYWRLQPDYFDKMPKQSGVFIALNVPIEEFGKSLTNPGDVDILVIPYHGNNLILHRTLAIEAKAIRASFEKQGKSPNKMGFSQANALLDAGFPFSALLHLIVSDQSPTKEWREISVTQVLNEEQEVSEFNDVYTDMLPRDLTERAIARLETLRKYSELGLAASYTDLSTVVHVDGTPIDKRLGQFEYMPMALACGKNPKKSYELMKHTAQYYQRKYYEFVDVPRWDP